jgi:hypothetical protein
MTDYIAKTGSTTYNKSKFRPHDRQRVRVAQCTHNAATTAIPASNVVNVITIPANSIVLGATVDVVTGQANTDIKLGMTASDDYWSASIDTATAGTTIEPATVGTGGGQLFHTNAATNVTITAITNAVNSAVVIVRAVYVELDAQVAVN